MTTLPNGKQSQTKRFWMNMIRLHHSELLHEPAKGAGTRWHWIDDALLVSLTFGTTMVRVFVRSDAKDNGDTRANHAPLLKRLSPFAAELEGELGVKMGPDSTGRFFVDALKGDFADEANWDSAADWLFERSQTYETALRKHLKVAA